MLRGFCFNGFQPTLALAATSRRTLRQQGRIIEKSYDIPDRNGSYSQCLSENILNSANSFGIQDDSRRVTDVDIEDAVGTTAAHCDIRAI
jgi:hypothetical protein